ncbi:M48 family metallopeptidase [Desulfospira joergensenii]|uniref:M48 family metallopeptidase n=1 Tax=Desulfospira joergensenii TaxID=53329 RepID=UPI003133961F
MIALTGGYLLHAVADLLNLVNLGRKMPEEFSGIYDPAKYEESQEYLKTNTWFGLVTATVDLSLILIFWFCGGFRILDAFARNLGQGSIITGLVFTGVLLLLKFLVSLPFSLYSTFVIEEKFGFNQTTLKLFILDLIRSMALTAILGGPLLALIIWFFESWGPLAWIYCWMASGLFILMVQYIVPTWIMPLFNKFTPLEQGSLKEAIFKYADSISFSLSNVFVMDGSKRSTKSNAFFTGFGKNKRIVLFDTLISRHTDPELVSILAHEMGHFKKKHILKRLILGICQMGAIFFLISIFISHPGLFRAFFVEQPSVYAGLVFFTMLFTPIDMVISLILQISSRKDEYEADRFAAQTLDSGAPLIEALKKLSVHNLSNLTPHPFYVFLNYSHPPVLERIKALRKIG